MGRACSANHRAVYFCEQQQTIVAGRQRTSVRHCYYNIIICQYDMAYVVGQNCYCRRRRVSRREKHAGERRLLRAARAAQSCPATSGSRLRLRYDRPGNPRRTPTRQWRRRRRRTAWRPARDRRRRTVYYYYRDGRRRAAPAAAAAEAWAGGAACPTSACCSRTASAASLNRPLRSDTRATPPLTNTPTTARRDHDERVVSARRRRPQTCLVETQFFLLLIRSRARTQTTE